MGDTSERVYGNRAGIGQHRVGDVGATNNGQRQRRDPDAYVGQPSGGDLANVVPGSKADSMTNTTHGAAENDFDRANRHGKA